LRGKTILREYRADLELTIIVEKRYTEELAARPLKDGAKE